MVGYYEAQQIYVVNINYISIICAQDNKSLMSVKKFVDQWL